MSRTVDERVQEWIREYSGEDLSVADLLCDRHDPRNVAFEFLDKDMNSRSLTFGELSAESRKVAAGLRARGVRRGDRVPVLLGKRPELVIVLLAIWRIGAVHVPLFTAFASGAINLRISDSAARLLITERAHQTKLDDVDDVEILIVEDEYSALTSHGQLSRSAAVGSDGALVQLYTSGTTGPPKGVVVPVRALAAFASYMHFGLDLREDDVFWNAADPGWAYGLYFGVLGPLAMGQKGIMLNAPFTPESTVYVMRQYGVTNFAGAPTIYRALRKGRAFNGVTLRRAASAGEPLPPDIVEWAREALGTVVLDHYGQTELGMAVCNHAHPDLRSVIRSGSMGVSLPGYSVGIIDGQIAVDCTSSPLMWFTGYYNAPERSLARFTEDGRWYLTGDAGYENEGSLFFTARDDDLILASGYRIGPFDVESVLLQHPAVADVAVVGHPDPEGVRGEIVKAFVVLSDPEHTPADISSELIQMVRNEYSKHAAPRQITFVDELPRTPSGKVQRYRLRNQ